MSAAQQQEEEKQLMEEVGKFKPDPNLSLGENIAKLVKVTRGYQLMNEDNKKMLEKVKTASTNNQIVDILMKDPVTGSGMSYAESRMKFG